MCYQFLTIKVMVERNAPCHEWTENLVMSLFLFNLLSVEFMSPFIAAMAQFKAEKQGRKQGTNKPGFDPYDLPYLLYLLPGQCERAKTTLIQN